MSLDFSRGRIYLDPNYRYPGTHVNCDKLLLILNVNHSPTDPLIVVPATTNDNYKDLANGCHPEFKFFHFQKRIGFYKGLTLIQLGFAIHFDYVWFSKRILAGEVKTEDHYRASEQEISSILSCLKSIKEDVPEFFWKYL